MNKQIENAIQCIRQAGSPELLTQYYRMAKMQFGPTIPDQVKKELDQKAEHFLHGYAQETKDTSLYDLDLEILQQVKSQC